MEEIKPFFIDNFIPICFSANDKYVPLLAVELQSIIDNSSSEKNYDIIVLMTDICDENRFRLLQMIRDHKNFSLRFINVGPYIFGYNFFIESDITNTKYSNEIYFRILVPALMPSYDYVLFLDADLVVLDDVAKLLNYDMKDNMLGAVRDYEGIANCYNNNLERTKYRIDEIGIKDFENYFISGVIVFNIKKFNAEYSSKQLLDLSVSKQWRQLDQDLLNYICKGNIKIFDAEWDFVEDTSNIYNSLPQKLFDEYRKSEDSPKIIHYSGSRKPWININSKYNKYFWKYAEKTSFLNELKSKINL